MKSVVYDGVMRSAFLNMQVPKKITGSPVVGALVKAAESDAGKRREPEWNAHLRLRTYNELKARGVMQ